jgi:hypothetical protein
MTEQNSEHSPDFFWKHVGNGISYVLPVSTGCSCGRSAN